MANKNPILTIIFFTYNRHNLFPIALNSIQQQSFRDYSAIIIDNGSTPPISLPEEISSDTRFSLLRISNNNQKRAENLKIIQSIDSKYTAFLFDDDRWTEDKLEKQIAHLEINNKTVACVTHATFINENEQEIDIPDENNVFIQKNKPTEEWILRLFTKGNCLSQASALVRTDTIKKSFIPIPYIRLPDFFYWTKILQHGNIYIIEEKLTKVGWSADGTNLSAINDKEKAKQLIYENSRILHQFRKFKKSTLKRAFALRPDASHDEIEMAMAEKAIECGTEHHFRFAAEVAEENFKRACIANKAALANDWINLYEKASGQSKTTLNKSDQQPLPHKPDNYNQWQSKRTMIAAEIQNIEKTISQNNSSSFHLCMRMAPGQETALADTLDSLSAQSYPNWHLTILTELPKPDGLDDIPCIDWHTAKIEKQKHIIDEQIEHRRYTWCIEIPAGVKLDPFYLWRLSIESEKNPATHCFFVDDEFYDESKKTLTPRFKPGSNPSALLSSDLAGPVCISREAWKAIGGAAPDPSSPWFSQLLKISDKFGWDAILHVPDILLSYPWNFFSNIAACILQLREHLNLIGSKAEILQTTPQSWCVRHTLLDEPRVTLIIFSGGVFELLSRCLESICSMTEYKNYEILVSLKSDDAVPDILNLLEEQQKKSGISIQHAISPVDSTYAFRCNSAVDRADGEFIAFIQEEAQAIQETWLGELVRTAIEDNVAAVMPRLIAPGSAKIENLGDVLGLGGIRGTPYRGSALIDDTGYLDYIQNPRDISLLPHACYLIKKQSYKVAGGMDELNFPDLWTDADLSMKFRKDGNRLICQPLSNLVVQLAHQYNLPMAPEESARKAQNAIDEETAFIRRWWPNAAIDPFWNPNLSLAHTVPTPETRYQADWKITPLGLPRILARPVDNGQGYFRVTAPLKALQRTNRAQQCIWNQTEAGAFTAAEIIRLAPDSLIVQNYMSDGRLRSLAELHKAPGRPFTVFTVDDLMDGLAKSNPLITTIPPNPKARLKHAFAHCDRLVVSTDFLAETYQHLISDIKVVPNRLEQAVWLPHRSAKRTTKKPRIGWAGGTTHHDDLLLLKEVIEKTRDEADWIFMGMCPDEIRPLISEFHNFVYNIVDYPAYLASLNIDIAVAPLADIPFNRAKSNLRLLEYGILGIPVVCTDIDPYRNSPACRVSNTAQKWIDALRERIHNPEAREAEGMTMRRWVLENYLLENHLNDWLDAHLPPGGWSPTASVA